MVHVPQRSDAWDIVQDTAVALWRDFSKYDDSRPFCAWAIGYARMQVRRYFRSVQRRARLSELAVEALMMAEEEFEVEREGRDLALRRCLEGLPCSQREMLTGYYFDERPIDELAALHRRSIEAVYKTLQRIRHNLLECINRRLLEAR